jgi:hypothetical protein
MLEPTKKVISEYCILMVKMIMDFTNNNFAKAQTLNFYVILTSYMGLLMLDEVNILISFGCLGSSMFHDLFIMRWIIDLNIGMEHLTFGYDGQHLWAKHLD